MILAFILCNFSLLWCYKYCWCRIKLSTNTNIYTDKRLAEDKNFKLKTANGTASYGKVNKKWNWQDDEATIKALKDTGHNEFIKVTESLDKVNLKKSLTVAGDTVVDENGEIIEGIKITEYRNFNVKY